MVLFPFLRMAIVFILSAGCSTVPIQPGQVTDPTKTVNTTENLTTIIPSASSTASTQNSTPQDIEKRLAPESLRNLVVMDLAHILGVDKEKIVAVQFSAAIWSDAQLGCVERKGVHESTPIPGYKILLEFGGQIYEYHTDNIGNYRLCQPPPKPLGPIK